MKNTFLTLCALSLSLCLMAGIRTPEAAKQLAAETLTQYSQVRRAPVRAEAMTLAYTVQKNELDEAAYYVFNHNTGDGFAVIAADDRVDGVILYSETGSLNEATMNPSLKWWLSRFQNELSALTDEDTYHAPQRTTEAVEPLLGDITWDQDAPYNYLCPIDIADNTRCYTGCVATAAAQIMRYWNFPMKGIGTKTYSWQNYDPDSYNYWGGYTSVLQTVQLTADYENTYYDWMNMLPSYASTSYSIDEGQAVATLMYHCGVACEMQYGGDAMGGSGAMIDDMANGMVEHFGYTYERYMDQYSQSVTINALQEAFNSDLELGRPILMGGYDTNAGGHAFVCDGRDASGKYHINWGWEGEGNCYTTLSQMKPTTRSYRFNQYLDAAIGMHPSSHPTTPSDGHYASCKEANNSEVGDTLFMKPVTVVYQNGDLTYLQDATGGALLYGATYSLNPGDVVEGIVGLSAPNKSLPQMRGLSYASDLTITASTAPEPMLLTELPNDSVMNRYVRIEGLLLDGRFTTASRTKKTAYTLDSLEIVLYNQFRIGYIFSTDKCYTVEGFVARNNDEIRIYPIAYEEHVLSAIDETTTIQAPLVRKVFVNGQVCILRDGVRYNMLGQKIE